MQPCVTECSDLTNKKKKEVEVIKRYLLECGKRFLNKIRRKTP